MTPWEKVQRTYLETGLPPRVLARRFGVRTEEIKAKMQTDGWERLYRKRRVEAAADRLLTRLEQAAEELTATTVRCREKSKTDAGGEVLREYDVPGESGSVDRAGLKQLTGVLKDIKDILSLGSDAEDREQEARIARLEQDLQKVGGGVCVTMEQEAQSYAQ